MRVLEINATNFGSTGNIMLEIAKKANKSGIECYTVCAKGKSMKKNIPMNFFVGTRIGHNLHLMLSKITGRNGCFSYIDTMIFIKKIKILNVDVIHFHNIHNDFFNIPMLIKYINKNDIKVIWTLHDCWSFTGHCPYFDLLGCEKWIEGCYQCGQYHLYPGTLFDNSRMMYRKKKNWFTSIKNLTIVTPSHWLSELVKKSYLKKYSVHVINNGIDLSVFKPTESDFVEKHGMRNKKIILGVALCWEDRKGLDVFVELSNRLPTDYQIVLVGTNERIDNLLPDSIISIHRTDSQQELAAIYTASDVFVNPTREENYPTVNMEAIACGTPVITFDTGGSAEIVDSTCGVVVAKNDIDSIETSIYDICQKKTIKKSDCLIRAREFDMEKRFGEYIKLYERIRIK